MECERHSHKRVVEELTVIVFELRVDPKDQSEQLER